MIVRREHLKQFASSYEFGDHGVNMLVMISKDLLAHLDDAPVRSYATGFMNAALKANSVSNKALTLILKNARALKDVALYQKVLEKAMAPSYASTPYKGTVIWPPSAVHNTRPRGMGRVKELLPTIGEICNGISAPQKSDWDDW